MRKLKVILVSVGAAMAAGALLLALVSLICAKAGKLPRGAAPVISTVIGCAAVFFGSWVASLWSREKGILTGLVTGAVFSAALVLVSLLLFQLPFAVSGAGKIAALFLSGSIGGILGVNRKSRVKF